MNVFFSDSEAFECNDSQHSIEEQQEYILLIFF